LKNKSHFHLRWPFLAYWKKLAKVSIFGPEIRKNVSLLIFAGKRLDFMQSVCQKREIIWCVLSRLHKHSFLFY